MTIKEKFLGRWFPWQESRSIKRQTELYNQMEKDLNTVIKKYGKIS